MRHRCLIGGLSSAAVALAVGSLGAAAAATTTGAPTTTVAGTTTAAATTVAPTTVPLPSLPPPADEASDPVATLVPGIIALDAATNGDGRQTAIATALAEQRNAIGIEQAPAAMCAVVTVAAPLTAGGRWELDGEPLESTAAVRRDPPGYGDCLDAEDVGGFDDGAYQYVAVGPTGATSAVATLVVGAPSVVVWLLNDGDQPVCLVQASPEAADLYESFASDSPILPGEALAIRVADVVQDVRVFGCPPDDVLRSFDLDPQFGVYVALVGDEPGSTAAGTAPSTTVLPTTTG
jgi:hypothetical protein